MDKFLESKKLEEFFCHRSGRENKDNVPIYFADSEGIRCRLGLCVRLVWDSCCGFIAARPISGKFTFSISKKRLEDFGVCYVASPTRNIEGDLPGRPVVVDLIEDNGVYYYTIIFEKNGQAPRLPERVDWE